MAAALAAGLTVCGNLAADRIGGRAPSAGGCPTFAPLAIAALRERGSAVRARVIGRCAPAEGPLFDALRNAGAVSMTLLEAKTTAAFTLRYDGERRTMAVEALGEPWTPAQIALAGITTTWVHVAPLLRGEFPAETLAALHAAGHMLSFDGQGLVRAPQLGELVRDRAFDPALLGWLRVLKLAEEEAAVIAGGSFSRADAARLGVAEVLVTRGSAGVDLYLNATRERVASARRVERVQATGAGDMFAVAYAGVRAAGGEPLSAAQTACEVVEELLAHRASVACR